MNVNQTHVVKEEHVQMKLINSHARALKDSMELFVNQVRRVNFKNTLLNM